MTVLQVVTSNDSIASNSPEGSDQQEQQTLTPSAADQKLVTTQEQLSRAYVSIGQLKLKLQRSRGLLPQLEMVSTAFWAKFWTSQCHHALTCCQLHL